MKVYFMFIILFVLTLNVKMHIAKLMEEMVKKGMHIILNVTNSITMDI
jgi:hypothetical protein